MDFSAALEMTKVDPERADLCCHSEEVADRRENLIVFQVDVQLREREGDILFRQLRIDGFV